MERIACRRIKSPVVERFVVATIKSWNSDAYARRVDKLDGEWTLIDSVEDLTESRLRSLNPSYVFFPHWSHIVPDALLNDYACVCFHMTDLPYGRGGSPLQNLIARGHNSTKVTALRMTSDVDAGPVYLKRPMSLSGTAQDIYERTADIVWDMIEEIVRTRPEPTPQIGDPTNFKRRNPEESRLPKNAAPIQLYDHIRMLDADTYPRAFIEHGSLRIEFSNAKLRRNKLSATARLVKPEDTDD